MPAANMTVALVERGVDVVVLGWLALGNGDGTGPLGRGECASGFVAAKWETVRSIMVHPHVTAVSEQPRAADGVVKVPPASKAPQQPGKEAAKTADAKAAPAPAPHGEARILTVTPSNQLQGLPLTPPVVVTHGVQIVHSSGELFQEYRYGDIRTYHGPAQLTHTQFPAAAPIGLPSRAKAPAQVRVPEVTVLVQIIGQVPVRSLKYVAKLKELPEFWDEGGRSI